MRNGGRTSQGLGVLVCLGLTAWAVGAPAPAAGPRAEFAIRLNLVVEAAAASAEPARLTVTPRDGSPGATLTLEPGRIALRRRAEPAATVAAAWQERVSLPDGPHTLVLKQCQGTVVVCLDARQLATVPLALSGPVSAVFQPGGRYRAADRVRVQAREPIRFADDFARAGEGAELWESSGGRFVVSASLHPGSSQGGFQLWASAPNRRAVSLATGSHWFWDDYTAGVSVRADRLPATCGLVFDVVDLATYHVARLVQPERGAGAVEIVRVRQGREEVLAHAAGGLQAGEWARLTVVTWGTQARAYLNGQEVGRVTDPGLVGGRVGLLVERSQAVWFDDVTVTSTPPDGDAGRLRQPFGPGEQEWSDYSGKSFTADPFMSDWARPASFWATAGAAGGAGLWWFRTRLYHDVEFRWDANGGGGAGAGQPVRVVLFGEREQPASGYRLELAAGKAVLSRQGTAVSEAPWAATAGVGSLRVAAGPAGVRCEVNGQQLLAWPDPQPLGQGEVAADLGPVGPARATDWRDRCRVLSSHRLDYSFEDAPAAWEVQSGIWQGTHRWACVPRWSFFGGRGEPGAAGVTNGNAVLWNRRLFRGDIDLELFVAPMEGTPQFIHFAQPVTANVAFASDGRHLDSGYMLLFGTYDTPSRLYRDGREVAVWKGRVSPDLRRQPMTLYHRLSQVWQHIRIQRRGGHVCIDIGRHDDEGGSLGLERAFDFDDPSPPDGERFGLWTWGPNGLAMARATVSYADSPGSAPLRLGTDERTVGDVAVRPLPGRTGEPPAYQRVRNLGSGGLFSLDLSQGPVDLERTGTLEFDGRFPPGLALSVLAEVRGQRAEMVVCGPDRYRPFTVPLGRLLPAATASAGRWHHARLDLRAALRRVFPEGPLVARRVALASPCDTPEEIAGLGVNRAGAHYDLANVRWTPSPPSLRTGVGPRLEVRVNGRRCLDDFEQDTGQWERLGGWDGAALYRDPHEPAAGGYSLRLLNRAVGGPAGAWATQTPYDLSCFPRLAFDYRFPAGVAGNLVVRANGRWFEVRGTGVDATWPVVGQFTGIVADGTWRHTEVDLAAALAAPLGAGTAVTVEALAWADTRVMSTPQETAYWLDNVVRVPAVDPTAPTELTLDWGAAGPVTAYAHVVDDAADTVPPPAPTGNGATLVLSGPLAGRYVHVRGQNARGQWSDARHLPVVNGRHAAAPAATAPTAPGATAAAAAPPGAPRIAYEPSDRLCWNDFEWQRHPDFPDQELGEFSIRREAWALRGTDGDAATGQGAVQLVNLDVDGFDSVFFRRSAWDVERWPVVAFDYRFEQPGGALNLSLLVNEAMTIVEWTGPNARGGYFDEAVVGRTEPAVQDGQWHHTEFDLLEMLTRTRYRDPAARAELRATELATWSTSHDPGYTYRNPVGVQARFDNFTICSRRGRAPAFTWRVDPAPADGLDGYACLLDQAETTEPPAAVTTRETRATFTDVAPGTWFLHVRACDRAGRWGATGHRRVVIEP